MSIEPRTRMSNEAYERLALAEPGQKWELRDGYVREKPPMTDAHRWLAVKLGYFLLSQLDWSVYQVRVNAGRVHRPGATFYIPDVFVLPTTFTTPLRDQPGVLEVYDQPLPLVVEVWSRSTGNYDVAEKLVVYQQRGDDEIWLIHPYEQTLNAWRRQPSGDYEETTYREGVVRLTALPGVEIDLAVLFDM